MSLFLDSFHHLFRYAANPDDFTWVPGQTPFSSWFWPVGTALGYLFLIYLITLLMKNRPPLGLKTINIIHNINLFLISLVMMVGVFQAAYRVIFFGAGWMSLLCERTEHEVQGRIGFWVYVFYLSKYYEMVDTILLALKKKPIIFLHIFHHMVMVPVTWKWLDDQWLNGSWWCTFVNSLVHCFMYYYYFLTSIGRTVWWKKYITQGQLIQFFTGFVMVSIWFIIRNQPKYQCKGGLPAALFSHSMNCLMIILFFRFYFKTYKEESAKQEYARAKAKKLE